MGCDHPRNETCEQHSPVGDKEFPQVEGLQQEKSRGNATERKLRCSAPLPSFPHRIYPLGCRGMRDSKVAGCKRVQICVVATNQQSRSSDPAASKQQPNKLQASVMIYRMTRRNEAFNRRCTVYRAEEPPILSPLISSLSGIFILGRHALPSANSRQVQQLLASSAAWW